ncbi:MAG: NAD-reducing hydrogenase large subunit [Thermodesulfobacteriota bacterium]|nr:NAD-reducing hydrogenase large subunit [Thermodesulfobacteriota bacterium]
MSDNRKITINPISRIEGHGKVVIHLDSDGNVEDAKFHVTQFRGYERFCQGRPFEEMPIITQRICGICPVSHQLASAKACDAILGVRIPDTATALRRLIHMGQFIQSHALHFFYLASPDLLFGWDSDPEVRNVVGVIGAYPAIAKKGIHLRKFGQDVIRALGGKSVHPAYAIPGGVINCLAERERDNLLTGFAQAYDACYTALDFIKEWLEKNRFEIKRFANYESLLAGLVDDAGCPDMYNGKLRIRHSSGTPGVEFDPEDYLKFIAEHVESWSYLKFPYFKEHGFPQGFYRVGPLARINMADAVSTPKAQAELLIYREKTRDGLSGSTLLFHYARMIELLNCLEAAEKLLQSEAICGTDIQNRGHVSNNEGVGVIEAPRGTLIHHYKVDKHGVIEDVNLIVATGHNNYAMNLSVGMVA